MLPIQHLLILAICASVNMAILEWVGQADLEAVRIRLEEEKAKRLLLQNDVEVLMLQVEELKRGFSQISKDDMAPSGNVTFITPSIAFTATHSKGITHVAKQTVIFDNVMVNEGNCYDSSTGIFLAPFRGLYSFSVTVLKANNSTSVSFAIMKGKVQIGKVFSGVGSNDSGSVSVVTVMDKGQTVSIQAHEGIKEAETMHRDNWSTFTGLLHVLHN